LLEISKGRHFVDAADLSLAWHELLLFAGQLSLRQADARTSEGGAASRRTACGLVRPRPEELAVTLYERVTLKLRKAIAAFVGLALPHAQHAIPVDVPETVDKLGMLLEMTI